MSKSTKGDINLSTDDHSPLSYVDNLLGVIILKNIKHITSNI